MNVLGFSSHATAALAFAALAALVALAFRSGPNRGYLILASVCSSLWALAIALAEMGLPVRTQVLFSLEVLRDATWIIVLLKWMPGVIAPWLKGVLALAYLGWLAAGFFPGVDAESVALVVARGGLANALVALMLLEQLHRNSPQESRRAMNLLAFGLGGVFAYDLFLYSQSALLGNLEPVTWSLRGFANAALVPLIARGARRLPRVEVGLDISRAATFYTSVALTAGVYLLCMAAAGFVIREFGGEWGEMARVTFFIGAIIVLVVLFASGHLRRQLRVFLSKHFYRQKYDYRAEWLRFARTLSGAEVADMRVASVQSVAQILLAPGGVLYTLDESRNRYEPVAAWPIRVEDLPEAVAIEGSHPLAVFMKERRWIVDLRERETKPALYDDVPVPQWLAQDRRWRLVSPIFHLESMSGFFIFFEPPAHFRLTYEDRDLLHTVGQHVATLLAQQESDRRVAELSQFEAYTRLTAFLMHDLKNAAAQLSLVVSNAARHKHNPAFIDDAIATTANATERIQRLIEHLGRAEARPAPRPVALLEAVAAAVGRCAGRQPAPVIEPGTECQCRIEADRDRMIGAFEHVLRNAQDATGQGGEIRISIRESGGQARVEVRDDGAGMDAEFVRKRLFRPFDSSKGASGMGIGAYQAREFARSVGGAVEVISAPGQGTRFTFILPVMA